MSEAGKAKPLVLILDGQPHNLQMLATVLQRQGYLCAAATTTRQAAAMIASTPPDLILLDLLLPGEDGLVFCRRLKEAAETREIPTILLTVKAEPADIVAGFNAGAVDYIVKPFHPPELIARVRTHLALKRARDEQARLIKLLNSSLAKVKKLKGLLPICSYCKKIRDDTGYWQHLESYLAAHSQAKFRQSLCPHCAAKR